MEYNGQCRLTGELCWNNKVLQRYARRMTEAETSFSDAHPQVTVQPGDIDCEGVVENVYGLGKVCLPSVEPALVIFQDVVLEHPANAKSTREIKGFKFIKPDGSPWHTTLNI